MSLQPYLVDVPVKINIWIRPDCQRRQFEVIKKARPSILFIQSDGGRSDEEWRIINQHRQMFDEEIDWECTVYRLYEDHNHGMYAMGAKMRTFIWEHVDRCIFLEDDDLPAVSFFQFCAELLERYKDDERIYRICGTNIAGIREDCTSDYFFSQQGSIWGTACWKRSYDSYDDFAYGEDPYTMRLLRNITAKDHHFRNQIETFAQGGRYQGHVAGDEYYARFSSYGYHQLQIVPTRNMISMIGFGADAAHADDLRCMPRSMQQVFNTPTYEMEFPMRHPRYMIPDVAYDEMIARQFCMNHPIRNAWRRMQRFVLTVRYGGIKRAMRKVRSALHPNEQ